MGKFKLKETFKNNGNERFVLLDNRSPAVGIKCCCGSLRKLSEIQAHSTFVLIISIIKITSWSRRTAGVPVIMFAVQMAGRNKKVKGKLTLQVN